MPPPLVPGDRVRLNQAGIERYSKQARCDPRTDRAGQVGTVVRLSEAAPGLVQIQWEGVSTADYYRVECLEIDTE
jgi:hypothetical protein